jgi:hypothetical protein
LAQDESVQWHNAEAITEATRRHLNLNTLSVRFDPGAAGEVVDIRSDLGELEWELNGEQNSDDDSTGVDVYPDMVMPAGLAVGYTWQPPAHAYLWETNPRNNADSKSSKDYDFTFQSMVDTPQNGLPGLHPPITSNDAIRAVCVYLYLTDAVPRPPVRTGALCPDLPGWGDPQDVFDRVLFLGVRPQGSRDFARCRVSMDESSDKSNQIAYYDATTGQPLRFNDADDAVMDASPTQAIVGAGRALVNVMREYPKATIILTGRVPKCLSLGLGWYLANASNALPIHPWRRLVPLGAIGRNYILHPFWVYRDQPSPQETLASAGIAHVNGLWVKDRKAAARLLEKPGRHYRACRRGTSKRRGA